MAGDVPTIAVLALGAGASGGADALRLLLAFAGKNPVGDICICVLVFAILTAHLLGTVLLARFVRKAPMTTAGAGAVRGAPAADPFAHITLLLSLGVASLVTACLVVVSGGLGSTIRVLADFAAKYPAVPIVAVAATAAGAFLPRTMPLFRILREPRNARGGGAAPADRAATTRHAARFIGLPLVVAACALLVAPFGAHGGGLDALRLPPGFTNVPVAVAAGVVGAVLLVRFYRRAR